MEKERTIKELLIILRDEIKNKNILLTMFFRKCGMCHEAFMIYKGGNISWIEYSRLLKFIRENRPFFEGNLDYAFKPGLVSPRVKWLNKQIEKL